MKDKLKVLLKGVKNIDKVIEGYVNDLKLDNSLINDEKAYEIIKRRVICEGCPYMSKHATTSDEYFSLTGEHYNDDNSPPHCALCSCPINRKTACLSCNCGIKDWNDEHPNKQLPLKWEAIT